MTMTNHMRTCTRLNFLYCQTVQTNELSLFYRNVYMLKLKFTQVCYLKPSRGDVRPQLRGDLVGYLATESVFFFFSLWLFSSSFSARSYKRRLLAADPACLLTVSWLKPPDSHRSIVVHPSGRGHAPQLSPSLQIKSMSYPSWASCL